MVIDFESLSLKDDSTTVPLNGEKKINRFIYDFERNKWNFPEILKTHKPISNEASK